MQRRNTIVVPLMMVLLAACGGGSRSPQATGLGPADSLIPPGPLGSAIRRGMPCQDSGRGVALPNTTSAPSSRARFAATRRASYRGSLSCL